jgi:ABC-type uncharacterized transport system auxiliary subunit
MNKTFLEIDFQLNLDGESCESVVSAWMSKNADEAAIDWKIRKVDEQNNTVTASVLFDGNRSASKFVSGPIARVLQSVEVENVDVKSFWNEDLFEMLEDRRANKFVLSAATLSGMISNRSDSTVKQSMM